MEKMKSRDFSVASVARAAAALNRSGPKAQSIRNVERKDFRDLISGYTVDLGQKRSGSAHSSAADDLVAAIPDLRTAALVRETLNVKNSLRRRLDLIKNQYSKLAPVDIATLSQGGAQDVVTPVVATVSPALLAGNFTPMEIAAVSGFLRKLPEHSEDVQLEFDQGSGARLWRGGVLELAGPGFPSALEKVTGLTDGPVP